MIMIPIFLGVSFFLFPQFFDLENLNPIVWLIIVIAFFAGSRLVPLFFENNPFKNFFNKKQNMNPLNVLLVSIFIFLIKKYDLF